MVIDIVIPAIITVVLFFWSLGSLSIDNRTAATPPRIKNLIGRVRKNKRAARAARTLEKSRAVLCKTSS